jgi:hypothetical protein
VLHTLDQRVRHLTSSNLKRGRESFFFLTLHLSCLKRHTLRCHLETLLYCNKSARGGGVTSPPSPEAAYCESVFRLQLSGPSSLSSCLGGWAERPVEFNHSVSCHVFFLRSWGRVHFQLELNFYRIQRFHSAMRLKRSRILQSKSNLQDQKVHHRVSS